GLSSRGFLLSGFLGRFFLGTLLRRFLFGCLLSCRFLFRRLLFRRSFLLSSGFARAAAATAGGSRGFGRRWRRGSHRLAHCRLHAAWLFFLLFLFFKVLFQRFAVGAAVAEVFFFITCVESGIVERHCSS